MVVSKYIETVVTGRYICYNVNNAVMLKGYS